MPFTFTTYAFQAAMRAAAVELLTDYGTGASLKLQVYPARPLNILPPTAFVDRIDEDTVFTGPTNRQRTVRAECLVVHGVFDTKEAADQRDAFVDGFMDYVTDHREAAGDATVIGSISTVDVPVYNPDWGSDLQRNTSYYATRIVLEGFASA
jgi:hypothetical protein